MNGEVGTITDERGQLCLHLDTKILSSQGMDITGIYLVIGGYMMKYWKKNFYINEDGSHQPITVQCRCGNFVDIKYYDKRKHAYTCDMCGDTSPQMIKG